MKITYTTATLTRKEPIVLILGKGDKLTGFAQKLDTKTQGAITRAIKATGFRGDKKEILDIVAPLHVPSPRLVLIGAGKGSDLDPCAIESLGGTLVQALVSRKITAATVDFTVEGVASSKALMAAHLAFGACLGNYRFDTFKTKKGAGPSVLQGLTIFTGFAPKARSLWKDYQPVADSVNFARDLVNMPANVLSTKDFVRSAESLRKLGVKVNVIKEAAMRKLGMNALLGVGQGSASDSYLVTMEWRGAQRKAPLAFVGKGVVFDTGGISLKPAPNMEDMKGDMGGAACVTGVMRALALRKAKVHAIGVIGLVENMPSGKAQRPGDIVKSMSGQTIEVLNTDAEGRLVLADALWYTQKVFKPSLVIDLATLTGAILVALGQQYAGLFSNNSDLAKRLTQAGEDVGESLWQLPLHASYDKMINTPNADVKNIGGGRYAGSITAAQFLQRFITKTPWAHIDIAGTAMGAPKTSTSPSWASGFGVRLLNRFVKNSYEK